VNADDTRRLGLAVAAFRAVRERDREHECLVVHRVERRLERGKPTRTRALSVIFALLGFAGLSYADTLPARETETATLGLAEAKTLGTKARGMFSTVTDVVVKRPALATLDGRELGEPLRGSAHVPHLPAKTHPARSANDLWFEVAQSVQRGDTRAAERALGALEASRDPETHSKAILGRAALELASGNCERVRTLASSVERAHPPAHPLVRRARELGARCRPQP
jgi:hypothetical protein